MRAMRKTDFSHTKKKKIEERYAKLRKDRRPRVWRCSGCKREVKKTAVCPCWEKHIEIDDRGRKVVSYNKLPLIRRQSEGERKLQIKKNGPSRSMRTEFYQSREWKDIRVQAITIHGRQCQACGASPPDVVIHVDHVKSLYLYWDLRLKIENLQVLCADCNYGKGSDHIDFRDPTKITGSASWMSEQQ